MLVECPICHELFDDCGATNEAFVPDPAATLLDPELMSSGGEDKGWTPTADRDIRA